LNPTTDCIVSNLKRASLTDFIVSYDSAIDVAPTLEKFLRTPMAPMCHIHRATASNSAKSFLLVLRNIWFKGDLSNDGWVQCTKTVLPLGLNSAFWKMKTVKLFSIYPCRPTTSQMSE